MKENITYMYEFGFIGVGNMGSALVKAATQHVDPSRIILANRTATKAEVLAATLGCAHGDNLVAAKNSRFIMLGVKPQAMADMLSGIAPVLSQRKGGFVLVSMAAGLPIKRIQELVGSDYPVIRIMPNTPCAVGDGVLLCCRSENVSDADYSAFKENMSGAGTAVDLNENLFDAGCAISGCGPAYVYMFIEAMADAGVACGLPRADAVTLASITLRGSADLVLQSGKHTAQLKDNVCSPGGSTIAGVMELDRGGFRAAIENCVLAAYNKTRDLASF